jgi:hypothetical protein
MIRTAAIVTWIHTRLLRLYPRAFAERFAGSMRADFEDATADALARGTPATLRLWLHAGIDLGTSLLSQWARRPRVWMIFPAIAGTALSLVVVGLVTPRVPVEVPLGAAEEQALLFFVILLTALFPIVAVIFCVTGFLLPRLRPRRRRA